MKFYFAAKFEDADKLLPLVAWVHGTSKNSVTSSWLHIEPGTVSKSAGEAASWAFQDLRDIDACDMLVLFNFDEKQSPGRNIEFGYALAKGKRLGIVGKPHGVFQHMPGIEHFPGGIEDFMHWHSAFHDGLLYPYVR